MEKLVIDRDKKDKGNIRYCIFCDLEEREKELDTNISEMEI